MILDISQLYEMQKRLDARIIEEKNLRGQDLMPNTVLALLVEIAELANEWRGFKHWSNDQEPRTKKIYSDRDAYLETNPLLEEYVDCLHFFLSIARQLDLPEDELYLPEADELKGETSVVFTELLHAVARINAESYATKPAYPRELRFKNALYIFFALGEQRLGFTWDQITAAYVDKNKVNHVRQDTGY